VRPGGFERFCLRGNQERGEFLEFFPRWVNGSFGPVFEEGFDARGADARSVGNG
jgi:hypothetical protein